MAIEDQVKVLEDEFKLLKSEMKQTLVNVRDFLLDLRIPPMQEEKEIQADPPQAPAAQQPQQYSQERPRNDSNYPDMSGQGQMPQPQANSVAEPFSPPADEMPTSGFEDQVAFGEEEITDEPTTAGDFPMEKEPTMSNFDGAEHARHDTVPGETGPMPSQVNLLANLIRWVASAKKEIGIEQLPVFLNVYAITGKLSPEMKDVILHLAEVATDPTTDGVPMDRMGLIREQLALFMKLNALNGQNPPPIDETIVRLAELLVQQSTYANKANLWSQLLLELNGILGNGNISLHLLTTVGLQDDG